MTTSLRLSGALIDVPRADHASAVEFWTAALGKPAVVTAKFPDYAQLDEVIPGVYFMVQATGDDTRRVHLDFDSADRDADVARLVALGARELSRSHHWVVLVDPAGTTFCVVQAPGDDAATPPPPPPAATAGHRSRLAGALIDVPAADYAATTAFWATALGRTPEVAADDPDYTSYGEVTPGVELMVQAVGDAVPRIHLDIETDDIEAEVARLTALGATEVARIHTWVVMRDPVGTVFCVVRVQIPAAFAASATTWTT
jgi:predicted enzyme related to lactoylglutathione lyase